MFKLRTNSSSFKHVILQTEETAVKLRDCDIEFICI